VGRFSGTGAHHLRGRIAGLYAVDALLTPAQIDGIKDSMHAGLDAQAVCRACPAGQAVGAGGACVCNAGFEAGAGSALGTCVQCAAGKYKAAPGNAACTPCPAHSTSLAQSCAEEQCHCDAGFYKDGALCVQCDVNTFRVSL